MAAKLMHPAIVEYMRKLRTQNPQHFDGGGTTQPGGAPDGSSWGSAGPSATGGLPDAQNLVTTGDSSRIQVGNQLPQNTATQASYGTNPGELSTMDNSGAIQGSIQTGLAGQSGAQQAQTGLMNTLGQEIQGKGPNLATEQLNSGLNAANAQAASFAASQRGVNPGLAAYMASQQAGQQNLGAASQAAQLRAQQQINAQNELAGVAGTQQQQNLGEQQVAGGLQAQQNEQALQNAQLNAQIQGQNATLAQNAQGQNFAQEQASTNTGLSILNGLQMAGLQGWQRTNKTLLIGDSFSAGTLNATLLTDFGTNPDAPPQVLTFPSTSPLQVRLFNSPQRAESFSLDLYDSSTGTNGEVFSISGLLVE